MQTETSSICVSIERFKIFNSRDLTQEIKVAELGFESQVLRISERLSVQQKGQIWRGIPQSGINGLKYTR